MKERFPGVIMAENRAVATRNMVPGKKVYGEKLVIKGEKEYRLWNPRRSKLSAAIYNGLRNFPIKDDSKILYLGAASGTTVSHISDITTNGRIYAVEFSRRTMRELVGIAIQRENLVTILADARHPEEYIPLAEECDIIYQDVAQADQAGILLKNADVFLKKGGHAMLAIKARSIDVRRRPEDIFEEEIARLKKGGFRVLEKVFLGPYEKDHAMVVAMKV